MRLIGQSPGVTEDVHPSVARLLDFAKSSTAATNDPVTSYNALAVRLDISLATLTNWKSRGISKDGALDAEREFGCLATWLLDGTGRSIPAHQTEPSDTLSVTDGPPPYLSADELLVQMGMLLARIPPNMRAPFADLLAGWAASGGTDDHRLALLALIGASRKRQA